MTPSLWNYIRSPYFSGAVAALIIMTFSFVNGYALFFNDSRSYVHGPMLAFDLLTKSDLSRDWPERQPTAVGGTTGTTDTPKNTTKEHAYTANRSIFYGMIPFVGYLSSSFWLAIFIQAYLVSLPIAILALHCLRFRERTYFLIVTILAAVTPIGVFAALMMPDILAGAMILYIGIAFGFWDRLTRGERVFLTAGVVLSALAHASHVAILFLIILFMFIVFLFGPSRRAGMAIAVGLLGLIVGILGNFAFDKGMQLATGQKPLVLPHVMAHLIDMGPGYAYIKQNCPASSFTICRYEDRLPQYWEDFIGADPKNGVFASADLPTKHLLSDEQYPFALAVFRFDPIGVSLGLTRDGLQQLLWFSLKNFEIDDSAMDNYNAYFPKPVSEHIAASAARRFPSILDVISLFTYASTIISLVVIAGYNFLKEYRITYDPDRFPVLALNRLIIFGVVANAAVCGVIASPYDRFQARVIWLLPLLAMVDLAFRFRSVQPAAHLSASGG